MGQPGKEEEEKESRGERDPSRERGESTRERERIPGRFGAARGTGRAIKSSTGAATLPPELSRNLARRQRVEAYEISFSFPAR